MLLSQMSKRSPEVKSARHITEHLVTDEAMINLIHDEIDNNKECKNGSVSTLTGKSRHYSDGEILTLVRFILDDFPRNVTEARLLDEMLESRNQPLHRVIEVGVSDSHLLDRRITGRLTHLASGRMYHTIFHPPKEYMKDDITGEPLVHRSDDTVDTTRERLSIYNQRVSPISDYYKRKGIWREVDGSSGPVQVHSSIMNAIYR